MKRSLIFFVFCLIQTSISAQNPLLPPETRLFPLSWVGIWKGELEIFRDTGRVQSLPMELHILPTDTSGVFSWTLIYGEDKEAGKRDYLLRTVDEKKGLYVIDERNSIVMEAYFFANKLFNRFSVMESLLLVTTEWRDNKLCFEVISGQTAPVGTSGGKKVGGEDIPAVQAFPIGVLQRAVLRRS